MSLKLSITYFLIVVLLVLYGKNYLMCCVESVARL
jgi:hypothetical protein